MGHDRLELQVIKEAHLLFKVIDERYKDNKSLIFTTNIEEPDWPEFLGDPISTSAILHHIFYYSVIVRSKAQVIVSTRVNFFRMNMQKRKQRMQKQDNNRGLNYKSLKGADLVGAFFMVWPSLWNLQNLTVCFVRNPISF